MIDLLLTDSGDIDIETVNRNNKLNISFLNSSVVFLCFPKHLGHPFPCFIIADGLTS